jgi:hypothetical protein
VSPEDIVAFARRLRGARGARRRICPYLAQAESVTTEAPPGNSRRCSRGTALRDAGFVAPSREQCRHPDAAGDPPDMVRPGIMLHGVAPDLVVAVPT